MNRTPRCETPKPHTLSFFVNPLKAMSGRRLALLALLAGAEAFVTRAPAAVRRASGVRMCDANKKPDDGMMQRPVLDNLVTKSIYSLEMLRIKVRHARLPGGALLHVYVGSCKRGLLTLPPTHPPASLHAVQMMKEKPTEENGGWEGEPRAWADDDSLAQRVSKISQVGVFASLKQWIAESIAGDYDREAINKRIDDTLASTPVVMFSFSTCPFCLKAKGLLKDDIKLNPAMLTVIECDEDPEG